MSASGGAPSTSGAGAGVGARVSEPERPARSLAEKLDALFEAVRPDKGEFSYEDVASALRDAGGRTISATYVWQLRRGIRDNPTKKHLEALAQFFGVTPSYFFDEETARKIEAELDLLTAMRSASVREVALRSAELSPEGLDAVRAMVDQVARLEGGSRGRKRGSEHRDRPAAQPRHGATGGQVDSSAD